MDLEFAYRVIGHIIIITNLGGMMLSIFPWYRRNKLAILKDLDQKLWHEQLVTVGEVAVGIALISL